MPLAFIAGFLPLPESVFGSNPWLSPWLWVPVASIAGAAFLQRPPSRRAVRHLLPFLGFLFCAAFSLLWTEDISIGLDVLGRLSALALMYFSGWTASHDDELVLRIRKVSLAWILAIAGVYFTATYIVGDLTDSLEIDRLMGAAALNLVALFIVASLGRPPGVTVAMGLIVLFVTVDADARTASLALIVLLVLAPSWVVPRRVRPVAGIVAVSLVAALLVVSIYGANWWFISGKGAIWDLATPGEELDLSGRAELWPAVAERCEGAWVVGNGVGSSSVFTRDLRPTFSEPHNEYLRVMCDNGVLGSALLVLFVVMVGVRAVRAISRSNRPLVAATASLQFLVSLLLLAITDIPLVAVIQFLAPMAVIWGWSDRLHASAVAMRPDRSPGYP
jgi:O-antigen ligase